MVSGGAGQAVAGQSGVVAAAARAGGRAGGGADTSRGTRRSLRLW